MVTSQARRWGSNKDKGDHGKNGPKGKKGSGKGKGGKPKGKGQGKQATKTKPTYKHVPLPSAAHGDWPADRISNIAGQVYRTSNRDWFQSAASVPPDLIVRPATSLLPDERVRPLPFDMDETQGTATIIQGFAERIPDAAARSAAKILHASGLNVNVLSMEILPIGCAYRCLYIPLQTHKPTPFGHKAEERTGNLWTYSICHGTDEDAATLILREGLMRPSKDDNEHVVSVGFFAQGTQGSLNRDKAQVVIQKELKLSKGLQGAPPRDFASKYQHHSAKWASCSEEQRICACTGVLRTSERWTFARQDRTSWPWQFRSHFEFLASKDFHGCSCVSPRLKILCFGCLGFLVSPFLVAPWVTEADHLLPDRWDIRVAKCPVLLHYVSGHPCCPWLFEHSGCSSMSPDLLCNMAKQAYHSHRHRGWACRNVGSRSRSFLFHLNPCCNLAS